MSCNAPLYKQWIQREVVLMLDAKAPLYVEQAVMDVVEL